MNFISQLKKTFMLFAITFSMAACGNSQDIQSKGMTLNSYSLQLKVGETYQLVAKLTEKDFSSPIVFASSDSLTVSVNEDGLVRALKEGQAVITAAASSLAYAKCVVNVYQDRTSSSSESSSYSSEYTSSNSSSKSSSSNIISSSEYSSHTISSETSSQTISSESSSHAISSETSSYDISSSSTHDIISESSYHEESSEISSSIYSDESSYESSSEFSYDESISSSSEEELSSSEQIDYSSSYTSSYEVSESSSEVISSYSVEESSSESSSESYIPTQSDYTLKMVEGGYSIVEYNGDEMYLVLPTAYQNKNIIKVETSAFRGNTSIKTLTIANENIELENYAFADCTSLTDINITSNNVIYHESVFQGCSALVDLKISSIPNDAALGKLFGSNKYRGGSIVAQEYEYEGEIYKNNYYIPNTLQFITVTGSQPVPNLAFNNLNTIERVEITNASSLGNHIFKNTKEDIEVVLGDNITFNTNTFAELSSSVMIFCKGEESHYNAECFPENEIYFNYNGEVHNLYVLSPNDDVDATGTLNQSTSYCFIIPEFYNPSEGYVFYYWIDRETAKSYLPGDKVYSPKDMKLVPDVDGREFKVNIPVSELYAKKDYYNVNYIYKNENKKVTYINQLYKNYECNPVSAFTPVNPEETLMFEGWDYDSTSVTSDGRVKSYSMTMRAKYQRLLYGSIATVGQAHYKASRIMNDSLFILTFYNPYVDSATVTINPNNPEKTYSFAIAHFHTDLNTLVFGLNKTVSKTDLEANTLYGIFINGAEEGDEFDVNIVLDDIKEETKFYVDASQISSTSNVVLYSSYLDKNPLPVFEREGASFNHYYETIAGENYIRTDNKGYLTSNEYVDNATYHPNYTFETHKINYILNSGEVIPTLNYAKSFTVGDVVMLPDAIKDGKYFFKGWYSDQELKNKVETISGDDTHQDVTLYPKFVKGVTLKMVYYNNNILKGEKSFEVVAGSPLATSPYDTKAVTVLDNFFYYDWYTDEARTNKFSWNMTLTDDLTLYSKTLFNVSTIRNSSYYYRASQISNKNTSIGQNSSSYYYIVCDIKSPCSITFLMNNSGLTKSEISRYFTSTTVMSVNYSNNAYGGQKKQAIECIPGEILYYYTQNLHSMNVTLSTKLTATIPSDKSGYSSFTLGNI